MRSIIVLIALVSTVACTVPLSPPIHWTKTDFTTEQFSYDEYECAQEANGTEPPPELFVGGLVDVARLAILDAHQRDRFGRCMEGRGYTRT